MPKNPSSRIPCFLILLVAAAALGSPAAFADTEGTIDVTFEDVNPDNSDTDPSDPDGATGGRVNGLAVHPTDT